jgi:hypothetical protein
MFASAPGQFSSVAMRILLLGAFPDVQQIQEVAA